MRQLLLIACLLVGVLAPATGASAFWRVTGLGVASGSAATMPTGAMPTATASARSVTVSWAQSPFAESTLGAKGGGYVVKRYAEGSATPVAPGAGCSGTITGFDSTLSCVEANVPYGRWRYRITPVLNSFTGTEGPPSAVVAVALAAPVLNTATAANPAEGATNGPIALGWSSVAGATGYDVFRRVAGGSFDYATALNGAIPLTGTTYSDTTGANGATYDYVVRAVAPASSAATSADSNQRSAKVVTRPVAPAGAVTAVAGGGGSVDVAWSAVARADGYNVFRRTTTTAFDFTDPLNGTTPATGTTFRDREPLVGRSYVYVVRAVVIGADAVQVASASSAQSAATSCESTYTGTITSTPGLNSYFRLGEASGTTAVNAVDAKKNGIYGGGVTFGQADAIVCDANPAVAFNGSTGFLGAASGTKAVAGPNVFTVEVWFKTTVGGGKLVGFGNQRTTQSSKYDRHVYLTDDGRLVFGVYLNAAMTVTSPGRYDDGAWHLATASLGAAGMRLSVDGLEVAADPAVRSGESYSGYWRAGWDQLAGWPDQPSNPYFTGALDELAIYSTQLSAATIAAHHDAGRP